MVEPADENHRWRRLWVYELATDRVREVSVANGNIWEAVWCGNTALAAIVSSGPGEGLWYTARLCILDVETAKSRDVYTPRDQLGWPAASPSGRNLAIVEALCSDRWFVAGDLHLIETQSGKVQLVDTGGVDITYTEWRSERVLLLAGHRGLETVVGLHDVVSGSFKEVWSSQEITTGGFFVSVSGFGESGDCVLVGESFTDRKSVV